MKPGKRMREILQILQDGTEDGETWTSGELYNDAGMWSVSSVASDGVRYSRRANARSSQRLHESGYVMFKEVRKGVGEFGQDRVVFILTDKGRAA
jgi:hypothetical protein